MTQQVNSPVCVAPHRRVTAPPQQLNTVTLPLRLALGAVVTMTTELTCSCSLGFAVPNCTAISRNRGRGSCRLDRSRTKVTSAALTHRCGTPPASQLACCPEALPDAPAYSSTCHDCPVTSDSMDLTVIVVATGNAFSRANARSLSSRFPWCGRAATSSLDVRLAACARGEIAHGRHVVSLACGEGLTTPSAEAGELYAPGRQR